MKGGQLDVNLATPHLLSAVPLAPAERFKKNSLYVTISHLRKLLYHRRLDHRFAAQCFLSNFQFTAPDATRRDSFVVSGHAV